MLALLQTNDITYNEFMFIKKIKHQKINLKGGGSTELLRILKQVQVHFNFQVQ